MTIALNMLQFFLVGVVLCSHLKQYELRRCFSRYALSFTGRFMFYTPVPMSVIIFSCEFRLLSSFYRVSGLLSSMRLGLSHLACTLDAAT